MELYAFKRNNFLLNKLLPCLIIIMFAIMCLYGSSVYASYSFDFDNTSVTIPDEFINKYPYFLICTFSSSSSDNCRIYVSSSPIIFSRESGRYNYVFGDGLFWRSCNSSTIQNTLNTFSGELSSTSTRSEFESTTLDFLFANHDIYNNGYPEPQLVFQAPSQTQTIVASQVGEVEMNKILQEILGILPVVIVVLVGLIAIRKGILFLMARMKKV